MNPRLFVSYCRDDVNPEDPRLTLLVGALKSSPRGIEVICDGYHPKASVGESLGDFYKEIDTCDAAVVILGPKYLRRVVEHQQSGVNSEFERILYRQQADRLKVIPITFSGTHPEACPPEFRDIIAKDLTWLRLIPEKKPLRAVKNVRAKFAAVVNEITEQVAAAALNRSESYRKGQEAILRNFLFFDTKSRWDQPGSHALLDGAFVKTATFLKMRSGEIRFLIGKKGSGKSTITHVMPMLLPPKPRYHIRVEFEDVPFQIAFNILRAQPAVESDMKKAFGDLDCLELVWDAFLHLMFAWSARGDLHGNSSLARFVRRVVKGDSSESPAEANRMAVRTLFVYAWEKITSYIDMVMKESLGEDGIHGAIERMSPGEFRRYVFGDACWRRLEELIENAGSIPGTILITADGFDTRVDAFAGEGPEARQFERDLLFALSQLVLNCGPSRVAGGSLYEAAKFCVAVPHDRFITIRSLDRDRYRWRHLSSTIEWTGVELCALIRKRLAILKEAPDPKGGKLQDRYQNVVKKQCPRLPDEVTFAFGSARYRVPLFLYVLRHTFWRPRDVLFYYAALLSACDLKEMQSCEMTSDFVRQIVADTTHKVVEDEFLKEYQGSFRNIGEVVARFQKAPQVMGVDQLGSLIESMRFDVDHDEGATLDLRFKIEFLHEIGFLGFVLDRETARRLSLHRHVFSYNEPRGLEKLRRSQLNAAKFAINPIFCEHLLLDTSANPELILDLDWEYIEQNEALRAAAQ